MRNGARELDDLGRPVLATGGAGAVALRPQEVAGGRRGASCQSPVNHLPLSLALRGEDDEELDFTLTLAPGEIAAAAIKPRLLNA